MDNKGDVFVSLHYKMNRSLRVSTLTVSDTRTVETDQGGKIIRELASGLHIHIVTFEICKDNPTAIQHIVKRWLENKDIDAIIVTGGTGIAKRDCTIEAVQPLFDKEIPGFGELFRFISFQEDIGTRALLSRAVAGVVQGKIVFLVPGSTGAVKLAMQRLILPELEHLVYEATKDV